MNNFSIKLTKHVGDDKIENIKINLELAKKGIKEFERSLLERYSVKNEDGNSKYEAEKKAPFVTLHGTWHVIEVKATDNATITHCYTYDASKKLRKNRCLLAITLYNFTDKNYKDMMGYLLYALSVYADDLVTILKENNKPYYSTNCNVCTDINIEAKNLKINGSDFDNMIISDFFDHYIKPELDGTEEDVKKMKYLSQIPDQFTSENLLTWRQRNMYFPALFPEDDRRILYSYTPIIEHVGDGFTVNSNDLIVVAIQDDKKVLTEDFIDHILLDTIYLTFIYKFSPERVDTKE